MKAVFFDLDGTLTDPKEGITKSIQYALKSLNEPVPLADELDWCIGPPLKESFQIILGERAIADTQLGDRAIDLYRERFASKGLFENHPYVGIYELLVSLNRKGIPLFVATSKPHVYADKILQHFDLAKFFSMTFGSELDGTRSNKTELLKYAVKKVGCDPAVSFMVGDRKHDVIGALNNDMIPVGVTYGYGSKEELNDAGVHFLAGQPQQLLSILSKS